MSDCMITTLSGAEADALCKIEERPHGGWVIDGDVIRSLTERGLIVRGVRGHQCTAMGEDTVAMIQVVRDA